MPPEVRALISKEWRERRVQLALCTVWIAGGVAYAVGYELTHHMRAPVASFHATCMLFSMFAAVFLAMRTSLGEVTEKTLGFSSFLPVSKARFAGVRLGGGIVVLTAPIILGALLLGTLLLTGVVEQAAARLPGMIATGLVQLPDRLSMTPFEAGSFLLKVAAIEVMQVMGLFLVLAVIGARRRTEAQVGFIGAILAFLSLLLPEFGWRLESTGNLQLSALLGAIFPNALAVNWSYGGTDGSYGDLDIRQRVWLPLAANGLVLAGLAAMFVRRYGPSRKSINSEPRRAVRWRLPSLLSWLPLRFPGRIAALAWADLRQSLPLAVTGLVLACLMTAVGVLTESPGLSDPHDPLSEKVTGNLPGSTWFIAMLWATIVGSGIFAAELQPGLGHFWRSRPISPAVWFALKFLIGLLAVVGVLDGVTIAVSWNSPYGQSPSTMSRSYVACMPLLHAAMYSLAVLGVCWLRRAVIGAMVGILVFFFVLLALPTFSATAPFEPVAVYNGLYFAELPPSHVGGEPEFDLTQHHYPLVYGTIALVTLTAAALAMPAAMNPTPPDLAMRLRRWIARGSA